MIRASLFLALALALAAPMRARPHGETKKAAGDPDIAYVITTVAGNGERGFGGDGGPATEAKLAGPCAAAVDAAGNLYIADYSNHRIRRVDRDGTIGTLAGIGEPGFGGDGGPATMAKLRGPYGVKLDKDGNVYIADQQNNRIRPSR